MAASTNRHLIFLWYFAEWLQKLNAVPFILRKSCFFSVLISLICDFYLRLGILNPFNTIHPFQKPMIFVQVSWITVVESDCYPIVFCKYGMVWAQIMIKLLYPHSAMLGSLFYSFVGYNSVKLSVEQHAHSHDLSLTPIQRGDIPRRDLSLSRVRHVMLWENQKHSIILWNLGIPKMYMGTLGYNVQISL